MLDKQGKLLRNYTQNIDTLEQVAGVQRIIQCHGKCLNIACYSHAALFVLVKVARFLQHKENMAVLEGATSQCVSAQSDQTAQIVLHLTTEHCVKTVFLCLGGSSAVLNFCYLESAF